MQVRIVHCRQCGYLLTLWSWTTKLLYTRCGYYLDGWLFIKLNLRSSPSPSTSKVDHKRMPQSNFPLILPKSFYPICYFDVINYLITPASSTAHPSRTEING